MAREATIEPVPWRRRKAAIAFVAGGAARDEIAELRADVLRQLVERRGRDLVRIWWGRRSRQCQAAAIVLENAGRTGMLFHAPAGAVGLDSGLQAAVMSGLSRSSLEAGLSLVQAMVNDQDHRDAALLAAAGFDRLARLLYMRRELTGAETMQAREDLTWRRWGQFSEAELGEVIARTYEQSLDCPAMEGVRRIDDVIAGHKSCGTFCPQTWWLAQRGGEPAGCVLANEMSAGRGEIIYLGVAPNHRGHGLGKAMIERALAGAVQCGQQSMDVVVDEANTYAKRLYEAAGFRRRDVRIAYAMLQKRPRFTSNGRPCG